MFDVNVATITNSSDLDNVISSPTLRWVFIVTGIIIVILGITGNTIVLIGSIRYQAIEMDRASIVLLENIAFADLLQTIVRYIPMLLTLCAERWVMGPVMCLVTSFVRFVPIGCEMLLIAATSCYRLHRILNPLNPQIGTVKLKLLIAAAWVFTINWPLALSFDHSPGASYDPSRLLCFPGYNLTAEKSFDVEPIVGLINCFLPIFITIICNVVILATLARSRGRNSINLKSLRTVLIICLTFVISYIPTLVFLIIGKKIRSPPWMWIMLYYVQGINVVANPFIYTSTNNRFKLFMLNMNPFRRESSDLAKRSYDPRKSKTTSTAVIPNNVAINSSM